MLNRLRERSRNKRDAKSQARDSTAQSSASTPAQRYATPAQGGSNTTIVNNYRTTNVVRSTPRLNTLQRGYRAVDYGSRRLARLGPRFGSWGRGVAFGGYRWGYWGGWSFPWVWRTGGWYPWWFYIAPVYYQRNLPYIDPYTGQTYGVPPAPPGNWGMVPAPATGVYEEPPALVNAAVYGSAAEADDSMFLLDRHNDLLVDAEDHHIEGDVFIGDSIRDSDHWRGHDGGPMIVSLADLCHTWSRGEYELVDSHADPIGHELMVGYGFDHALADPLDFSQHVLGNDDDHPLVGKAAWIAEHIAFCAE